MRARSLSVPFSSGQWLLHHNAPLRHFKKPDSFSPLFIAAMVATQRNCRLSCRQTKLSVRFSSRQWLLLLRERFRILKCYPFSPLFIAAMVATSFALLKSALVPITFSPLFIAAMVATTHQVNNYRNFYGLSVRFSSRQWLLPAHASLAHP